MGQPTGKCWFNHTKFWSLSDKPQINELRRYFVGDLLIGDLFTDKVDVVWEPME